MLGKLVPCGGGAPIPLQKSRLVIGRKPDCDILLACPSISGRHCQLELIDGVWFVRDLESRNGTAVNGRKGEYQRLEANDVLGLGRQRMVVEYRPAVQAARLKQRVNFDADEDLAFEFLNSPAKVQTAPPVQPAATTTSSPAPSPPAVPASAPRIPNAAASATSSSDLGRLVPCGGGSPIPLRFTALILGRSPECDICIRFPSVSSRHCKLDFDEGYWLVEDLNSTNGTWVDGDRCMHQCLMPDSVLALHKYRYTIHYTPRSDGTPPAVKRLFSQSLLEKAGLAKEFSGDRLAGQLLPDDQDDLPRRYNLLDPEDES